MTLRIQHQVATLAHHASDGWLNRAALLSASSEFLGSVTKGRRKRLAPELRRAIGVLNPTELVTLPGSHTGADAVVPGRAWTRLPLHPAASGEA
jgi:hypothetical protein